MRSLDFSEQLLVSRYQGALPVVLTAPHGGDKQPPGVPKERQQKNVPADCRFEKNTDRFTRTITRAVAQALFDVFGEAPYVVMADFDRAFIDANRTPECAFDDPDARQFYEEYHNTIRGFVDEIRTDNGGLGLLFDIHGTTKIEDDPADVYLGTLNGAAITTLLSHDPQALSRKRSLPGSLTADGYVVSTQVPETLKGDFTLEAYGSANANGIDAIQIEIEADLRTVETKRNLFIEDLGFAISTLVARYTDDLSFATFRSANFLPRLQRGHSEASGPVVSCS
ncbi:MAG TPA: N-formylglutamate amidohydrolase [Pyrinomonadaceae bacterium]|nr:N-formylglutamate amidohydrolase [Pyrinomonadaceae bacterium]